MTTPTPRDPLVDILRIAIMGQQNALSTGQWLTFTGVMDLDALAAAVRGAAIVRGVRIDTKLAVGTGIEPVRPVKASPA